MYAFFDGVDVNEFIMQNSLKSQWFLANLPLEKLFLDMFPVLITVMFHMVPNPKITFRAAVPNHKSGPYNNPTKTYEDNPYNSALTVPAAYSSTSTILNVDTFSLANEPQGEYFGFIKNK